MISCIEGVIVDVDKDLVTLMVSGVGYSVTIVQASSFIVGTHVSLWIRLHWNQEDGPQLFGFKEKEDRVLFDLIISCPGVGPKIAMAALATMSSALFLSALAERDIKALSLVPGIGAKKAESMSVQLKEKVEKLIDEGFAKKSGESLSIFRDLNTVLLSLGYGQKEIAPAISYVRSQISHEPAFDECLKKALGYLAKT